MILERLSFRDLCRAWRFIVAVVACEFVGGLIGITYEYHYNPFLNLWMGGAIAILPGMILGAVWHFSGPADRRESIVVIRLLGFIGAAVFIFAVAVAIPLFKTEMRNLAGLTRLQQEDIRRIEVFDRDGKVKTLTVSDPDIIAAFTGSISDAVGHQSNHPQYTHSWYVLASGPVQHEFELHLDPRFPDSVMGSFVVKSGNRTSYRGSFKSQALRRWVDQQLI